MAIEDTFGYRFVRISLVLLNCLVMVRTISFMTKFSFSENYYLFFLACNFLLGIIGAIREHRVFIALSGGITLMVFLVGVFSVDHIRNIDLLFLTFLVISVQSIIFSEMLKERHSQRVTLDRSNQQIARTNIPNGAVTTLVLNAAQSGDSTILMLDPMLASGLPKDPPPSYFSTNHPPPKYDDAIKLNSSDQSLPALPSVIRIENHSENSAEQVSPNVLPKNNSDEPRGS